MFKFGDILISEISTFDMLEEYGLSEEQIEKIAKGMEHDGKFTDTYIDLMRDSILRIAKELNIPIKEEEIE